MRIHCKPGNVVSILCLYHTYSWQLGVIFFFFPIIIIFVQYSFPLQFSIYKRLRRFLVHLDSQFRGDSYSNWILNFLEAFTIPILHFKTRAWPLVPPLGAPSRGKPPRPTSLGRGTGRPSHRCPSLPPPRVRNTRRRTAPSPCGGGKRSARSYGLRQGIPGRRQRIN